MLIKGKIIDNATGQPIPSAAIASYSGNQIFTDAGTANACGVYEVDIPNSAPAVLVQATGYKPALIDMATVQASQDIPLTANSSLNMATAPITASTVLPGETSGATTKVPWGLIAAGAGALFLSSKSKNKISGPGFKWESLVVPVVVLGGGYLVLSKLGLFGSSDLASNNSAQAQQSSAANQQALNQAQAAGINPTLTQANAAALANDIFLQATSSAGTVSQAAQNQIASDIVNGVQNMADWYVLKNAFGFRKAGTYWSTCNFLGFNCPEYDLDAIIKASCGPDTISDIGNYLSSRGIQYAF
jgi:hypothetical protein